MPPNTTDVVKTLRSLLNSTPNGLIERQLWRDFKEMEGYPVPFRELGFGKFIDFLRATNEFELIQTSEGYHIRARLTKDSVHIAQLVSSQNRAKKKKNAKPMPFVPRRKIELENNWNPPTAYSQAYSQAQSQSQFRPQSHQARAEFRQQAQAQAQAQYQPRFAAQQQYVSKPQPRLELPPQPRTTASVQSRIDSPYSFRSQTQNLTTEQVNLFIQQVAAATVGKSISLATLQRAQSTINNVNRALNLQHLSLQTAPMQIPAYGIPFHTTQPNMPPQSNVQVQPETVTTTAKPVSPDRWKHDLYDAEPQLARTVNTQSHNPIESENKQLPPKRLSPNLQREPSPPICEPKPMSTLEPKSMGHFRSLMSRLQINTPKVEPTESTATVSSVWLTKNIDPPKKSVFERLGPKMPNEGVTEPRPSVQSRLNVKSSPVAEQTQDKQTDTVDFVTNKQQPLQPADDSVSIAEKKSSTSLGKQHLKAALEKYCREKGFDPPQFKTAPTSHKKLEGLVSVGGMTYSTLPFDYAKASDAEAAAARLAMENIKDHPVSRESSDEIAYKIYDCIAEHGVFIKYLPNMFEQQYETSLPDDWQNIIENRTDLFTIVKQSTGLPIVYKQSSNTEPHHMSDNKNTQFDKEYTEQTEITEVPLMELPFDQIQWTVDVTWVASTMDIWGQLKDSDHLEKLNHKLEEIERKLSRGKYPEMAKELIVGGIYLTFHEAPYEDSSFSTFTAYRIQVKDIDDVEKKVLCFYIDDGFEEWLSLDPVDSTDFKDQKIYQIPRELCDIPRQAIRFSLYNLQDFAENLVATTEIAQCLSDKQFVVRVKSTIEQYAADQTVTVMFYNEDGDNLNRTLLGTICSKLYPPKLETGRSTVVHVTHVSDTGDIYCRLHKSKEMQHIKQLIERLTNGSITDNHRVNANDFTGPTSKELFLVFDNTDKRWYRAMILPSKIPRENSAMCKFVDYGYTKYIDHQYIFKLASLSYALSKYPPQVMTVRLNGFTNSELSTTIIELLRKLLCCPKIIFIQSVDQSEIPMVNIWKRIDGLHLCKINESIRMEMTLAVNGEIAELPDSDDSFSSDEKDVNNDKDLPPHPIPNCNQIYKAEVVTAFNPSNFFVRLKLDIIKPGYSKMLHTLWKECENMDNILSKKDIKANEFFAARLEDGFWHRVKVQTSPSNDVVVVQNWDSGDIANCTIDALQPLPPAYHEIPQMVFRARLHGIQPLHKIWNKDDSARFKELTVDKEFMIEIKGIKMEGGSSQKFLVDLILISQAKGNISELMVRELRAKYQ